MDVENNFLTDLESSGRKTIMPRKWRIILIILSASLAVLNLVFAYQKATRFEHLNVAFQPKNVLRTIIPILFLVIPLTGFLLAIGFSFIPYKAYTYPQKYIPCALVIITLLQIAAIVLSVGGF